MIHVALTLELKLQICKNLNTISCDERRNCIKHTRHSLEQCYCSIAILNEIQKSINQIELE